ncbi:coiled-coil domain-containing protein 24 [Thalassophryne amazonica]|uniref:coiled-coil domain-containing protein 24 n=1 Tax=Thalassophryne amazonica TaxID=390379 RepID=UPI00147140BE|nr:coiled-coil domain-containing protein 24 [Thalassophryne amazonica]
MIFRVPLEMKHNPPVNFGNTSAVSGSIQDLVMKGLLHSTPIATRMQSTDENQRWFPGRSLWLLIAEYVPVSELPQIRRALGCALLDEYSGLHLEAEMLYKTWQEVQRAGNHDNRVGTPLKCLQGSPLADPLPIKELLKAEVRIQQQSIMERAIGEGRPHSCCSLQSNTEEEIEAMRDKLNITDIEKVVDQLRSVLSKECGALKIHIDHLKENIKRGSRSSCEVYKVDSFAELRDPRCAIHMDLEQNQSSVASSCWPSSLVPVTDLKNRHRFSAKLRTSDKILEGLTATSVMRPHPPPPLCQLKPSPPLTAKPRARCISTSASTEARKLLTPLCHSATACQHGRSHLSALPPRNTSDKIVTKTSPLAKPEEADVHSDICSFHENAKKSSRPQNPSQFSEQRAGFISAGREERSLVYKSGLADINSPRVTPPLSEGAQRSGDRTDHSLSTSGTSTGGAHLSREKNASEKVCSGVTGKYSVTFETVTPLKQNLNRTSCHGIHRNTSRQVV